MASDEPNGHPPEPGAQPGAVDDALMALEQRLDRASAAAERLLADAVARMAAEPGGGEAELGGGEAERGGGAADEPEVPADDAAPNARRQVPPSGWQRPGGGGGGASSGLGDLLGEDGEVLLRLLGALRDRIPPDLQRRLAEAIREVLLAVRALIDWYLERSERRRAEPTPIRDIPIL